MLMHFGDRLNHILYIIQINDYDIKWKWAMLDEGDCFMGEAKFWGLYSDK